MMDSPRHFGQRLEGALLYKYAIDVFSSTIINGWCLHRFDKSRPLILEFYSGGELLGETPVDVHRADLKKPSLHPSGTCGFSFLVPGETAATAAAGEIVIRVKDSGAVLCVLDKARAGLPGETRCRTRKQRGPRPVLAP